MDSGTIFVGGLEGPDWEYKVGDPGSDCISCF